MALVGLGLAIFGCEDDTQIALVEAEISVEADELNFGVVPVGATKRISISISNLGAADLEVESFRVAAPNTTGSPTGPFFVSPPGPLRVLPGQRVVVDVGFTPENSDDISGTLAIVSNDPETPNIALPLQGQGGEGRLVMQPAQLDLRNTTVGRSRSVEVVVQNLGSVAASGRLVTEGFQRPEHFRLTGLSTFNEAAQFGVGPRTRQILVLMYEPQALGDDNGVIRLEDSTCGPRCGLEVEVLASANEAVVRLNPPLIDFMGVGIGEARNENLQIENVGTMAATIESVAAAGSAAFSVSIPSGQLPRTLQPNEQLGVTVTFLPTEATEARGSVVVRTNLGAVPELQATLLGSGEGPLFLVRPEQISFGVERGPGQYSRRVLLVNGGSSQVRVTALSVSGSPELSLGLVPGLPLALGPGESLTVPVEFAPTVVGQFSGTLSVSSDDPERSQVTVPIVAGMALAVCEVRTTPERLLFGLMPPGHSRTRTVRVTNIGNDDCVLTSGAFRDPPDPAIRLREGPTFPITLRPVTSTLTSSVPSVTKELALTFSYEPLDRRAAKATYVFQTADVVFPERTISLAGQSDEYRLLFVLPPELDFGEMNPLTCPQFTDRVTLINAGTTSILHRQSRLTTADGSPVSPEFTLFPDSGPMPNMGIAGGDAVLYELGYQAQQLGPDNAELEITMDGFPQPIVVPLTGAGSNNPKRTERFEQVNNKEVDVLFVIDDSCSMAENQRQVAGNFDVFIRAADARQVDFQLGITTTDTTRRPGALVGPVITRATPNFMEEFRTQAAVGISGSGFETGLEAMTAALDEADFGNGFNADLIRPSAALVVIIVSDEDDQSALTAPQYATDLIRRTPNGVLVAVVSGQFMGCASSAGFADPAPKYENFLTFFGNSVSASICADWGQTLSALGGEAFGLRRSFRLAITPAPVPAPVVRVNGSVVQPPAYQIVGQDVVFANPPREGAEIVVEYSPDCLSGGWAEDAHGRCFNDERTTFRGLHLVVRSRRRPRGIDGDGMRYRDVWLARGLLRWLLLQAQFIRRPGRGGL